MSDIKLYLAFLIVKQYHGEYAARKAMNDYVNEYDLRVRANRSCGY